MARRRRRRDGGEARWVGEHLPRLVVTPPFPPPKSDQQLVILSERAVTRASEGSAVRYARAKDLLDARKPESTKLPGFRLA